MAVDERALQALYRRLQDVLGPEEADTMMAHLAPSDEMVTKTYLDAFEQRLDQRFESIDHRFESIDHRFESIDQRFESIDHRFDALERDTGELKHSVQGLKEQLEWRFAAVSERVAGGQQEVLATMRAEMISQTRTMVFALIGTVFTAGSLTIGAAAIGM